MGLCLPQLRKLGHNFQKLRARAEAHGLILGNIEQGVFDVLETGDVWVRARYLKTGPLRAPTLSALSHTSTSLKRVAADALRKAGHPVRSPSLRRPRR